MLKITVKCLLIFALCSGQSCKKRSISTQKDAGPFSVSYVSILKSRIRVNNDTDPLIDAKIRSQLAYTLGTFKVYGGSSDVMKSTIKVTEKKEVEGGFEISYEAQLNVVAGISSPLPPVIKLVFPLSLDEKSKSGVFDFYNEAFNRGAIGNCFDANDLLTQQSGPPNSLDKFWHHFWPLSPSCHLRTRVESQPNQSIVIEEVSGERMIIVVAELTKTLGDAANPNTATLAKFPHYEKVWSDGELRVAMIVTPHKTFSNSDIGIQVGQKAFNTISSVFERYQAQSGQNPFVTAERLIEAPYVESAFDSPRGRAKIRMWATQEGANFLNKPNARAAFNEFRGDADIILYAGHSGYGSNINDVVKILEPRSNQYQFLLFLGCNSFTYVSKLLDQKYLLANPASKDASIYYDAIVTGTYGRTLALPQTVSFVLQQVIEAQLNFGSLLAGTNAESNPVVIGEITNTSGPMTKLPTVNGQQEP